MSVDHYENFPVAGVLCPANLRPAVVSLYWFARTADDLADEGNAPAAVRLQDLAAYRSSLSRMLAGQPVKGRWQALFESLRQTVRTHHTSARPFPVRHLHALLDAFEHDVIHRDQGHRYANRDELLAYCALSANPVGRLMLHLFGVDDALSHVQSDAICTALQLINFWQDIRVDVPRGHFYLPVSQGESLQALCDWAHELMLSGSPLCKRLAKNASWRIGFELRLVVQGGLRLLDKIASQGFDTSAVRPRLRPWDAPHILFRALLM